jgi:hypothetical protein
MAVRLSVLSTGRALLPGRLLLHIYVIDWVDQSVHSAAGRIRSIEKSNDFIGIQTRYLPACSIATQPTTLPRAPKLVVSQFSNCTCGQTDRHFQGHRREFFCKFRRKRAKEWRSTGRTSGRTILIQSLLRELKTKSHEEGLKIISPSYGKLWNESHCGKLWRGDLVSKTLNAIFRVKLWNTAYPRKLSYVLEFCTGRTLTRNFIIRLPRKLLLTLDVSFLVPRKLSRNLEQIPLRLAGGGLRLLPTWRYDIQPLYTQLLYWSLPWTELIWLPWHSQTWSRAAP